MRRGDENRAVTPGKAMRAVRHPPYRFRERVTTHVHSSRMRTLPPMSREHVARPPSPAYRPRAGSGESDDWSRRNFRGRGSRPETYLPPSASQVDRFIPSRSALDLDISRTTTSSRRTPPPRTWTSPARWPRPPRCVAIERDRSSPSPRSREIELVDLDIASDGVTTTDPPPSTPFPSSRRSTRSSSRLRSWRTARTRRLVRSWRSSPRPRPAGLENAARGVYSSPTARTKRRRRRSGTSRARRAHFRRARAHRRLLPEPDRLGRVQPSRGGAGRRGVPVERRERRHHAADADEPENEDYVTACSGARMASTSPSARTRRRCRSGTCRV